MGRFLSLPKSGADRERMQPAQASETLCPILCPISMSARYHSVATGRIIGESRNPFCSKGLSDLNRYAII